MNQYVTGAVIKELREKYHLTQVELAEKLNVSDKTVSKWETAKGYPDVSLLESIAKVFKISVTELISGNAINNVNVSANMMRSKFYVCPVVCMGIARDNWYKSEQGIDRVLGELARCGNQFIGDIKGYLL